MDRLAALHKAAHDAQHQAQRAASLFHRAVADALAEGRSPTAIAEALGVSRGRVYQWRNKAL